MFVTLVLEPIFIFIYRKGWLAIAFKNVNIDSGFFEKVLKKFTIFQQLMAKMEELKATRERAELKIAILEAAREKEHVS